eukprot:scaffold133536_cov69-Phaeocystis_antarctica.AAC.5
MRRRCGAWQCTTFENAPRRQIAPFWRNLVQDGDPTTSPPCRMFCLDFAVAFVAHYAMASRFSEALQSHPVFTFTSGAVAGAAAAVLLYPVDQRVERGLWQATTQPISDEHAGF